MERTNDIYKIRPAGRHLFTIGRDLIQDQYAAVIELVKNSYDADSSNVDIKFDILSDKNTYKIIISDQGHGMTRETVINKWLVPSTDDKLKRRKSPLGRVMQGRKGVGRYAVSILGDDLLLETVTPKGEKTTVYIEWNQFEEATFLDDVEILVETMQSSQPSGTILTITADNKKLSEWDQTQIAKLRFELKKLISPVDKAIEVEKDDLKDVFNVHLKVNGFQDIPDINETIEPFPIFHLFDYRISGKINSDGKGSLIYSQQKVRNAIDEIINIDFGSPTDCGELFYDIRVYDREKESIESLIGRGLIDDSGNYVSKLAARQILNDSNGIGVYRYGFRLRPLGDADFDWLKLNEQRVQNPSLRVGSNQVIGYVLITSEEESGLIEKSARDGLRDNTSYQKLKDISKLVIARLEEKRFNYRKKAGISRPALKIEKELEKLFSFDELKKGVSKKLVKDGIGKKTVDDVIDIINKNEEDRNKIAEEIRQAVAVYQGQATLGKIINIILHEGRRPLSYFKNQIPNLHYWYDSLLKTSEPENLQHCIPIIAGVALNAEIFVKLFGRLDPLAAGKRSAKKLLLLKETIENVFTVFEIEMKKYKIKLKISGPDDFQSLLWKQDIYSIITNLADNSIYWMIEKKSVKREIHINISTEGGKLQYIDYRDTGPGIEPSLISSEVIFEPQFTTKPEGMGLGLAIAGEAASRNGLELKAFESETGAYFRLQRIMELK